MTYLCYSSAVEPIEDFHACPVRFYCHTPGFHASKYDVNASIFNHEDSSHRQANGVCKCFPYYAFTGAGCDRLSTSSYFSLSVFACIFLVLVYALYLSVNTISAVRSMSGQKKAVVRNLTVLSTSLGALALVFAAGIMIGNIITTLLLDKQMIWHIHFRKPFIAIFASLIFQLQLCMVLGWFRLAKMARHIHHDDSEPQTHRTLFFLIATFATMLCVLLFTPHNQAAVLASLFMILVLWVVIWRLRNVMNTGEHDQHRPAAAAATNDPQVAHTRPPPRQSASAPTLMRHIEFTPVVPIHPQPRQPSLSPLRVASNRVVPFPDLLPSHSDHIPININPSARLSSHSQLPRLPPLHRLETHHESMCESNRTNESVPHAHPSGGSRRAESGSSVGVHSNHSGDGVSMHSGVRSDSAIDDEADSPLDFLHSPQRTNDSPIDEDDEISRVPRRSSAPVYVSQAWAPPFETQQPHHHSHSRSSRRKLSSQVIQVGDEQHGGVHHDGDEQHGEEQHTAEPTTSATAAARRRSSTETEELSVIQASAWVHRSPGILPDPRRAVATLPRLLHQLTSILAEVLSCCRPVDARALRGREGFLRYYIAKSTLTARILMLDSFLICIGAGLAALYRTHQIFMAWTGVAVAYSCAAHVVAHLSFYLNDIPRSH